MAATRKRINWSKKDNYTLRTEYPSTPTRALAKGFGVSETAIRNQARRLNLRKNAQEGPIKYSVPLTPGFFTAGWPARNARLTEALSRLADTASRERWPLDREHTRAYEQIKQQLTLEHTT